MSDDWNRTPPMPRHAYTIGIKQIGIESPLWTWQIDLEYGNGVWDHGTALTRKAAVRQITRSIRRHSRKVRQNKPDDWWKDAPDAN